MRSTISHDAASRLPTRVEGLLDCLQVNQALQGKPVELVRAVLRDQRAPVDLLQSVERASRTKTAMFMRHRQVALILRPAGPRW